MHARLIGMAVAAGLGAVACGSAAECPEAERFYCSDLVDVPPAPSEGCCGDLAIDAVCVDGEWQCPEGATRECLDYWIPDMCAALR